MFGLIESPAYLERGGGFSGAMILLSKLKEFIEKEIEDSGDEFIVLRDSYGKPIEKLDLGFGIRGNVPFVHFREGNPE